MKIFTAFNSSAKASSVTKLHSMSHESAAKKQKMDDEVGKLLLAMFMTDAVFLLREFNRQKSL